MMKTQVEEKFSDFHTKWMDQLEELLQILMILVSSSPGGSADYQPASYEAVVHKLTAHHKQYYTFKWSAAHDDVLAFFAPVWLTPLENANLWVTGWKPSMAFRLVEVERLISGGLTEDQLRRIAALRAKIKMEEEKVEREMERQQVAVADRRMVELARLEIRARESGAAVDQVSGLVEAALKGTLAGLERVMKMADCVRLKTLKGLLEILSPMQSVDFLASKSTVQIQLRKWGKNRGEKCLINYDK